jgi:hypothetical protein
MAKRDPACIFCRIVTGEIPARLVHWGRDELDRRAEAIRAAVGAS